MAKAANNPKWIVIHHSAGSVHDTVETIRRFHIEKRGWQDIGYHRVILNPLGSHTVMGEAKDLIKQGRKDEIQGAHCPGYNTKSIGICLIGNFDIEKPPEPMIEALKIELKKISNKYLIPLENIKGHRELYATVCPGKFLFERLQKLKKELV